MTEQIERSPLHGLVEYEGCALPKWPPLVTDVKGRMEDIKKFDSLPTDILFCTYPRTGTNWMHSILKMILAGTSEYQDLKDYPYLEGANTMEELSLRSSPRVFTTHLPFRFLPEKHLKEGYKLILVLRNPKDVLVSLYDQSKNVKISHSDDFPGSWENWLDLVCRNEMRVSDGWFDYVKAFEDAVETGTLRNTHFMFYENMHQNPVDEIKRAAKFLGVDCSNERANEIHQKCSFTQLKAYYESTELYQFVKKTMSTDGKTGFVFRKGIVGDWKNWFTVSQNETIDAAIEREMIDSKLVFKYEL